MKKLIILGIVAVIILIVSVKTNNYIKSDAYKFKNEYEKLNKVDNNRKVKIDKDNTIKYATLDDIVKKIENKETFVVYFGFAKCPWCRSMVENLVSIAKEKTTTVYYVDIEEKRDVKEIKDGEIVTTKKASKSYYKLLKYFDTVLDDYKLKDNDKEYITGEKRIYAPNVIAVVDGKVKEKTEGVSTKLTDPYMKITKEMNNESKNMLKCIFKCLEESNVCFSKDKC